MGTYLPDRTTYPARCVYAGEAEVVFVIILREFWSTASAGWRCLIVEAQRPLTRYAIRRSEFPNELLNKSRLSRVFTI